MRESTVSLERVRRRARPCTTRSLDLDAQTLTLDALLPRSWYWGDAFFLSLQNLVFDGVFEVRPLLPLSLCARARADAPPSHSSRRTRCTRSATPATTACRSSSRRRPSSSSRSPRMPPSSASSSTSRTRISIAPTASASRSRRARRSTTWPPRPTRRPPPRARGPSRQRRTRACSQRRA